MIGGRHIIEKTSVDSDALDTCILLAETSSGSLQWGGLVEYLTIVNICYQLPEQEEYLDFDLPMEAKYLVLVIASVQWNARKFASFIHFQWKEVVYIVLVFLVVQSIVSQFPPTLTPTTHTHIKPPFVVSKLWVL